MAYLFMGKLHDYGISENTNTNFLLSYLFNRQNYVEMFEVLNSLHF